MNIGARRPFNEISVLFPLLTLYTAAYLALMAAEFFLRGSFVVPAGMMPIYIALLGAYAVDKATNRKVAARLQISVRSASRLLAEITAQGLIRQRDESKGTYYVLP